MNLFDDIAEFVGRFTDATGELISGVTEDFCTCGSGILETLGEAVDEFKDNPVMYCVDSTKEISRGAINIVTFPVRPIQNMMGGVIDVCRDQVTPAAGSIVYTDLLFGYAEHSGIYIGRNKIVQLNGNGIVSVVTPEEFITGGTGVHIYVSCIDGFAVGSPVVAKRAKNMLKSQRDYHFILSNCHQFSAGCLTGDFENASSFLWMLKSECETCLGSNAWRIWDL